MLRGLVCDLALYFWEVWDWGSGFGVGGGGKWRERKRAGMMERKRGKWEGDRWRKEEGK